MSGAEPILPAGVFPAFVVWGGFVLVIVVVRVAWVVMKHLVDGGSVLDFLITSDEKIARRVPDMDGPCQKCGNLLEQHYRWWVRHEFEPVMIWATPTPPPEDLDELPKARW